MKKNRPIKEQINIHDEMKLSRLKAIELAKSHVDTKPIKYLLK